MKKGLPIVHCLDCEENRIHDGSKMIPKEAADEHLIRFYRETSIARMEKEFAEKEEMKTISEKTDFFSL